VLARGTWTTAGILLVLHWCLPQTENSPCPFGNLCAIPPVVYSTPRPFRTEAFGEDRSRLHTVFHATGSLCSWTDVTQLGIPFALDEISAYSPGLGSSECFRPQGPMRIPQGAGMSASIPHGIDRGLSRRAVLGYEVDGKGSTLGSLEASDGCACRSGHSEDLRSDVSNRRCTVHVSHNPHCTRASTCERWLP